MKIHEYQGKEIFRKYGVPTPRGFPAFSVDEAVEAAKKLGGSVWVARMTDSEAPAAATGRAQKRERSPTLRRWLVDGRKSCQIRLPPSAAALGSASPSGAAALTVTVKV